MISDTAICKQPSINKWTNRLSVVFGVCLETAPQAHHSFAQKPEMAHEMNAETSVLEQQTRKSWKHISFMSVSAQSSILGFFHSQLYATVLI